ncbi:MAG: DegT/DnrJ/EryC1/StrS family aminotransferase [Planctomycetes bacterium]|nr:DegT/DnrJ/EryC1/StrS family aminotransferase [Planctomycetota bacterium]
MRLIEDAAEGFGVQFEGRHVGTIGDLGCLSFFAEKTITTGEGGAILTYLAEKAGKFLPQDIAARTEVLQWLFWQAAGLGPMAGQLSHFTNYAQEPQPYALSRYSNEYDRLLAVMDVRLRDREYIASDYSIADIAAYPWVKYAKGLGNDLAKFNELSRWADTIKARPAVVRGTALGEDWKRGEPRSAKLQAIMFNQNSATVYKAIDGKH